MWQIRFLKIPVFCLRVYKCYGVRVGKSTGIPTIQEELRNNGSPKAKFFTDDGKRTVTVEILIHPDFLKKDEPQSEPQNKINEKIIELIKENNYISRKEMAEKLGCSFEYFDAIFDE